MRPTENRERTIICVGCSEVVTCRMSPGRLYCSLACYRLKRPTRRTGEERPCAVCGTMRYFNTARLATTTEFFCGPGHALAWQKRNRIAYTCKTCAKPFTWSKSRETQTNPTYCSPACRDADPARRAQLIAMNVAQAKMRPNHLERAGYALLDSVGTPYERQHLIGGKFCVDAFVPAAGLVVQFDGDYWHGNPERFPKPDARQARRMKLDRSQDAYMRRCGYRVLRLWESEIRKSPDHVRLRLAAAVRQTAEPARRASLSPSQLPLFE